jgi:2-keto-4-pentenoate hydratase
MPALDPRIAAGTAAMLDTRAAALAAGAGHLGWKLAFGAPASMAAFGTDHPLVGFLTRDRLLPSGATVDISTWTKPVLEAEIAAHLGSDPGPSPTPAEALAAVAGWSIAIELADVDHTPTDLERVLAGNVFHRHVLLGPVVPALPEDLTVTVERDGETVVATPDPWALTGDLGEILASAASTLAACGGSLSANDIVITGSVVLPVDLGGGTWCVAADGLGSIAIEISLG